MRLMLLIKLWCVCGIILVLLSMFICEFTNYCPLVDYSKGTWSILKK